MLSDLLKKSNEQAEAENYTEALRLINAALDMNPALASAWHLKGIYLKKLERFEKSIECFEKALEFNPRHDKALCEKGGVLLEMKCPREALVFLDRAAATNANNSDVWLLTGHACIMLKRKREAITAYKRSVELGDKEAEKALHTCMSKLEKYERVVLDKNAPVTKDAQWLMQDGFQ